MENPPRAHRARWLGALVALSAAAGCGSCQGTPKTDPRNHLPADARVVIELSDLARLPRVWATVEQRFAKVVPAEDRMKLRTELQRSLGFDPFSEEGLKAAGLPVSGPVVGHATDRSAMWVIPVADPKLFEGTVTQLVEARAVAEKAKAAFGDASGWLYTRSFGAEKATVAALVIRSGRGFLGVGPEAESMVGAALAQKAETALPASPDYRALVARLEGEGIVRAIFPRAGEELARTLKTARSQVPMALDEETAAGVKGAAWQLDLTSSGLGMQGRLRLEDEALEAARTLFDTDAPLPDSLRQLDLPGSVLYLLVNGNADGLIARFAPESSRARTRLRRLIASLGLEEEKVLEALTGQLAVVSGLGDLSKANLQQLLRVPQRFAWSGIGIGVEDGSDIGAVTDEMKAQLAEREFEVKEVKVGEQAVSRVVSMDKGDFVLVDTFVRPGAIIYATEPAVTEGVLGVAPGRDPLKGKAGVVLELRLGALARRLSTFDATRLPLMFRSVASQGLEALAVFDRLRFVLVPTDEGISVNGSLDLAADAGADAP